MRRGLLLAAMLLPFSACSTTEILSVEDPDIINPGAANSPAGARAVYAGALGEFAFAVVGDDGGTEGQILVSGSFTDELINSETFPTRLEYELRAIDIKNGTLLAVFRNLQRARVLLEAAARGLEQYSPTPAYRISESFALAGLAYVYAGENYCSGVPFSNPFPAVTYGTPQTTVQVFTTAIERFDSALAHPDTGAIAATILNLARVGKGRALLNRGGSGDDAAAVAAVAAVPLAFVYQTTHTVTTARQRNGIFAFTWQNERFSVADAEGGNGLNFRTAGDPRVQSVRDPIGAGVGFDNSTPQWNPLKFPSRTVPTPIATGIEAKLIIAEVLLRAGNATWIDTLNFVRANGGVAGLAPLMDPGTPTARQDLLFRERAFWMYLSGHRLGDLRRLMRQYGRTEDAVFPTGVHFKGTPYGDDVNLPVPFDELNNPNLPGPTTCIDRLP
ncbi:MAG TPA: hypothetical protein VGQ06_12775 [Gemmatimonadales bacterium]|nr:hypothetical protein [Gemmatimonadales bacterium]